MLHGSLKQNAAVTKILTHLDAAASREASGRGSMLRTIKGQIGDLSVLADRVPALPASTCCQTFV